MSYTTIQDFFPGLELTADQQKALQLIDAFLNSNQQVFLLKGYAGSGKTTLLKGLIDYLTDEGQKCMLMAPTGRAAKVLSQKTNRSAFTIHKSIYSFDNLEEVELSGEENGYSYLFYYKLRPGADVTNTLFIVDEASMVSDVLSEGEFFRFGSGYLLKDLLQFARIKDPTAKNKILFVGDPAQLPPVGMNFSPALDETHLQKEYNLWVDHVELHEVKRQEEQSGILSAASRIRKCLTSGYFNNFDLRTNWRDVFSLPYTDFRPTYEQTTGSKIIISYKNKTALDLNMEIREHRFGLDMPIQPGDHIIIGANNYPMGIMNGEFGVVLDAGANTISRTVHFTKKGGEKAQKTLTWRSVKLLMPDDQEEGKTVAGYILENYLYGDNVLSSEERQALYVDFKNRFADKFKAEGSQVPGSKSEEFRAAIKTDSFFNAILLKFGYAVTCHKAQGGEWDAAFVFWDRGSNDGFNFLEEEQNQAGKTNADFFRWAYTAVTRASRQLMCVNPPYFNPFSKMEYIPVAVQNAMSTLTGQDQHPIEIELDEEWKSALGSFHLIEAALPIQNHFIAVRYALANIGASISHWEKVGFEIRYVAKRGNDQAGFIFWVNSQNEFKSNFNKLPRYTNSEALFSEAAQVLEKLPHIAIKRTDAELVLTHIEFEWQLEEQKPFLKTLFDKLNEAGEKDHISITAVDHNQFAERYTLERDAEKVVVDFWYDGSGFFGKVTPLEKKCNSSTLLADLQNIVQTLKNSSHDIS